MVDRLTEGAGVKVARAMRAGLRVRAWTLACLAGVAAAAPAQAQDPGAQEAADEARRLRSCLFYVENIEGGARAWKPFIGNLDATLDRYREGDDEATVPTPLRSARDDIYWQRSQGLLLSAGGMEEAYALLDVLHRKALQDSRRDEANGKCYEIHMTWGSNAEKAGDEKKALENYYAAADRRPEEQGPWKSVGALSQKKAAADVKAQLYSAALTSLRDAVSGLRERAPASAGGAVEDLEKDIDRILASTGVIRVAWLGQPDVLAKVPGETDDFRQARIRLTPADGGVEPPEQRADAEMRVRLGSFQLSATGSAGGVVTLAGDVSVPSDGVEVVLPAAVPEGMVYVPAGEGLEAFLIDRTEVSVTAFRGFAASTNAAYETEYGDETAVAGVGYAHAQQYAASLGKRLPSRDEWVYACFGSTAEDWDSNGSAPRYPWGNAAGEGGVHAYFAGASAGPGPTTGCEAGASMFSGCLNMAFNVWEWLDGGWAIGGAYNQSSSERTFGDWTVDVLRDAAPTEETWGTLSDAKQIQYENYRIRRGTLKRVGIRCVLPLGTPWR